MDNYVSPDYFYLKVANEMGLPREVVEKVYRSYLKKINETLETEGYIFLKGLGTFHTDPNKALDVMYTFLYKANLEYDKESKITDGVLNHLKQIGIARTKIEHSKKKYEYKWELIEQNLERFKANLGRFEEFFDNEGFYRGDSSEAERDLSELSSQEE